MSPREFGKPSPEEMGVKSQEVDETVEQKNSTGMELKNLMMDALVSSGKMEQLNKSFKEPVKLHLDSVYPVYMFQIGPTDRGFFAARVIVDTSAKNGEQICFRHDRKTEYFSIQDLDKAKEAILEWAKQ